MPFSRSSSHALLGSSIALFALLAASSHVEARHTGRRPANTAPAPSYKEVEFDRLEENTLHFKAPAGTPAPSPLKTDLSDLKYLGTLKPAASNPAIPPYFLFQARPCSNCQQESGIYAVRPDGGKPFGFVHPGKIFDHKSRALLMESRAFFGRCVRDQASDVYVVFQKERVDRRKQLQASVLIAEPSADHLSERLIEHRQPRLQDTLRLVKAKACREIEGRNRVMLARPLDVRLRRSTDKTRESDEEEPRKNQTDQDTEPASDN